MCGFSHSTFVTAPFSVTGLFASNSAAKEWCAETGSDSDIEPGADASSTFVFIASL